MPVLLTESSFGDADFAVRAAVRVAGRCHSRRG
jgi:hypothetical protein